MPESFGEEYTREDEIDLIVEAGEKKLKIDTTLLEYYPLNSARFLSYIYRKKPDVEAGTDGTFFIGAGAKEPLHEELFTGAWQEELMPEDDKDSIDGGGVIDLKTGEHLRYSRDFGAVDDPKVENAIVDWVQDNLIREPEEKY